MTKRTDKIYITALHLSYGGAERAITALANALAEVGFDVTLLVTYKLCEQVYSLDPRVKIRYLTDRRPNRAEITVARREGHPYGLLKNLFAAGITLIRKYRTMRKALREIDSGVVIASRSEHSRLLAKVAHPDVVRIAQLHQDHYFSPRLRRDYRGVFREIDTLVVLVPTFAEEIRRMMNGYNDHTDCLAIPNFLNSSENDAKDGKNEASTGKSTLDTMTGQSVRSVLYVGRLEYEKGPDRLLEVWHLLKQYPDMHAARLTFLGDGSMSEQLKAQAKELGIAEDVDFRGYVSAADVAAEMRVADVLAMTSRSEGFGYVLLEAMDAGLPAVAYDVRSGPAELIVNGSTGYLIPNDRPDIFAARLRELLTDPQRRADFARAGRERSQRSFSRREIVGRWLRVLKSAAERRGVELTPLQSREENNGG